MVIQPWGSAQTDKQTNKQTNPTPSTGLVDGYEVTWKRESYDYTRGSKSSIGRLTRREKRQSEGSKTTENPAAVNILIDSLVPGEQYSFTLSSRNTEGGKSPESTRKFFKTKIGLPDVPEIYHLEGSGRDAILIQWTAPDISNGKILGYHVYYRLDNSFEDVAAMIQVDGSQLQKNVTGLDEGKEYDFAVSAYTEAGEGDLTSWMGATARGKSIPKQMAQPYVEALYWNKAYVAWNLTDDGLTGIDTFTIYVDSAIDKGGQSSYVIPNRNDRNTTIYTLDEDTSYAVSIVATNNLGSSPRSIAVEIRTPKKPFFLRVWVAGLTTAIFAALFIILFAVLFYLYVWKKVRPPPGEVKKAPLYIGRDGGVVERDNRSLVLGNRAAGDQPTATNTGSERYSTRNNNNMRMSELQPQIRDPDPPRQPDYYNGNYNNNPRYGTPRGGKPDSYVPDHRSDQYDPRKDQYPDYDRQSSQGGGYYDNNRDNNSRYSSNRYPPSARGGGVRGDPYNSQYDDDRYSTDTYNNNSRGAGRRPRGGYVFDNPSAADEPRFSQI
eukprot:sb/3463612/